MRQKSFRKHINPRDVNNPLDDYLKELSLEYEIDKSLLLPWGTLALEGISLGAKNYHTHHVYFLDLFPVFGRYGRGTLRLRCSQEKHLELHRILAKCLESGDFSLFVKLSGMRKKEGIREEGKRLEKERGKEDKKYPTMPHVIFSYYRVRKTGRKGQAFSANIDYIQQDGMPSCRRCGARDAIFTTTMSARPS